MHSRISLQRRAALRITHARLLALLILSVPIATHAVPAHANGDPASDVLLAQDVFYPYQPQVSHGLEAAMNTALRGATGVGLSLKVAIIGSPEELGVVPNLFGHPQDYAQFLDREISFNRPQPLLVVMPAGFGLVHAGSPNALAGLAVDGQHGSYGLTRSAILAVVALARAHGSHIATPSIAPSSQTSHGAPALLVFGLPAALLALGGLAVMRVGRSRRAGGPRDNDGDHG
jgi:hypothetical protein